MTYQVLHTKQEGSRPFWYQLELYGDRTDAIRRANQYVLDNAGYVCVKDSNGRVVFGTDPAELDRAIASGINRHFTAVAA